LNGNNNASLPPLSERRFGEEWTCPQWETIVSLSCVRTPKPREPDSSSLSTSSPRGDSARLPRTQQSTRPHAHIWCFSHDCIQLDQKKGAQLPPLLTTLLAPDLEDPTSTTLELDELWSFVLKKAHHFWIWIALCRKTRQVVAYAVGDRSKRTCLRLWEAIPSVSSSGALLHRLLGSIRGSDPGGAAFRCGKRDGGDCPCGALE
jgi:hypothetical protein